MQIPAHDSVTVSVAVSFLDFTPFHFYDVVLSGDGDGAPWVLEPMISLFVRAVEAMHPAGAPGVAPADAPQLFALRSIAPNPTAEGTSLRLAVPGPGRVTADPSKVALAGETAVRGALECLRSRCAVSRYRRRMPQSCGSVNKARDLRARDAL